MIFTTLYKCYDRFFGNKYIVQPCIIHPPEFDKRYKTVVKCNYCAGYLEMLDWINRHSTGSVDVKIDNDVAIYLAFENSDDATIFRIKYSL